MKACEKHSEAAGITRLITQQVRLRHVEQVIVRGLPSCSEDPAGKLCFSIHERWTEGGSSPYTSAFQPNNNSLWNVEKDVLPAALGRLKCFVMRIWCTHSLEKKHVMLSWVVHLTGLVPVTEEAEVDVPTIMFRIQGEMYTAKECCSQDDLIPFQVSLTAQVNGSLVRPSCGVSSVTRLRMIQRAIQQNSLTKRRLFADLSSKVESSGERKAMNEKLEDKRLRLNVLKEYIRRKKKSLEKMESIVNIQKQATNQSGEDLSALKKQLEASKEEDKKCYGTVVALHEQLSACVAELGHRRKELITQLSLIYPITCDANRTYRICGVHLPNAEECDNIDDTQLSVGMGYVSHLVSLVSHFLDVPLRYPVVFHASRSQIKDHISSKLAEHERAFAFNDRSKAKYKLLVDYAIFLQNKNIGQLRWYCGLTTADLRHTLANLHSLLELRLGLSRLESPPRPMRLGECSPIGSDQEQHTTALSTSLSVDQGLQGLIVSPGEMARQASEPNLNDLATSSPLVSSANISSHGNTSYAHTETSPANIPSSRNVSGKMSYQGENLLLEINSMRQWDKDDLRLQLKLSNGDSRLLNKSEEVPVVVEPDLRDFEFPEYSPTGSLDSCSEVREDQSGTPREGDSGFIQKSKENKPREIGGNDQDDEGFLESQQSVKGEKDLQHSHTGNKEGETNGLQCSPVPEIQVKTAEEELNDEENIWKDVEGLDLEDFNEFACRAEALSNKVTTFNFRLGASRSTSLERDSGK